MMFSRPDILVTGAKGQLGSFFVNSFSLAAAAKSSSIGSVTGADIDDFDLTDYSSMKDFFEKNKLQDIDYVVHCAAATDTAAIEADPFKFYAANVLGTRNIARWCAANKIKLIFISTDYVFSELSPMTADGDLQEFPVNQYGIQKRLAELEVMSAYTDKPDYFSIVRSSWMFGNSSRSFVEKILKMIASSCLKDYEVKVVDDAFGCPTHVSMMREMVLDIIEHDKHGIFECFSRKLQMNRYEWASIIWRDFKDEVMKLDCDMNRDIINDIAEKVSLKPVSSSSFPSSMKHPGKLKTFEMSLAEHNNWKDVCTRQYIASNIWRLIKLFVENAKLEDKVNVEKINAMMKKM